MAGQQEVLEQSGTTVGEVARLSGVTVRTLHHYDSIGLLVPSGRSVAGYRLYSSADVERLQEILFYRELGIGLEEIQRLLSSRDGRRVEILRSQRSRLLDRQRRLQSLVEAIDRAIDSEERGTTMSDKEMLEVFDGFDPREHESEAEARWGGTAAHQEASRRTRRYSEADWERIKASEKEIVEALANAMKSGMEASSDAVADLADAHRLHIDENYYPCSPRHHVALSDLYVQDERFAEYWNREGSGLAEYVREAIATNALRSSAGSGTAD